jgi:molybdate transport system ATP-binding protein
VKAGTQAVEGGEVLVRIADASVRYDEVEVLHGVSWTIRQGENWALLGPNGSGKTTLLSLILGDNPQAYASDVEVLGHRRGAGESVWDVKHGIGYVAPEMQMHYEPDTAALAVVCSGLFDSVGLYRRPTPAQRQAAMAWLRRMGLARLTGRAFGDLSAGQQRVLLMARAMVKAPRLLVLDEPCQGLDAANRDRIVRLVDRMAAGGATGVVYVTHHFQEIPACVTHVLKLRAGRVAARTRRRM